MGVAIFFLGFSSEVIKCQGDILGFPLAAAILLSHKDFMDWHFFILNIVLYSLLARSNEYLMMVVLLYLKSLYFHLTFLPL